VWGYLLDNILAGPPTNLKITEPSRDAMYKFAYPALSFLKVSNC